MNKFKKLIGALFFKFFRRKKMFKINEYVIAGKTFKAVKDTIRKKPDQDDAWLFFLMGKFNNIYDVGSNTGQSSILAKLQNPSKRLLIIDPNQEALLIAFQNLMLNDWTFNCQFENRLITEKVGEFVKFYAIGSGEAGSIFKSHAHSASSVNSYFIIKTETLDSLYDKYTWIPDFIKIDVEGAEAQVLNGAKNIASHRHTWFMVEMHSPAELPMVKNADLVLRWCNEVKYTAWYMRDAKKLDSADMLADRGKCHLLLIPEGIEYPKELANIKQGQKILVE